VLRYVAEKIVKSLENGLNAIEGAMQTARKDEKFSNFSSKLAEGFKDMKEKVLPTVGHVIHVNTQQF
jgi:hypothetical protein